jgi:ribose transport system substrate-binding protein
VAVAACAALILSACSSSGGAAGPTAGANPATGAGTAADAATGAAPAPSASGKQLVIGWADPQAKQPIFTTFTDALNAAAARENVKIITLDGQANPSTQVSDIQTFITKKVDAIIVFPLVPAAEAAILNKAHDAGIKIIGLNAILPSAPGETPTVAAPYDADLDWGYVDGAATEAKYVAQQLHGKGNVVGIKIPVPVPSLVAMLATYKSVVTSGNSIKWLAELPDATDDLAGARSSMADAITRYKRDIQGVLAYTDISAIGAAQALAAAGVKGTVIVGQQGNQTGIDALKAGQIQGDMDTKPYTAAVWALALTKAVVAGSAYPKFVRLPIQFLTKANVGSYVPWTTGVNDIKSGKTSLDVTFPSN